MRKFGIKVFDWTLFFLFLIIEKTFKYIIYNGVMFKKMHTSQKEWKELEIQICHLENPLTLSVIRFQATYKS